MCESGTIVVKIIILGYINFCEKYLTKKPSNLDANLADVLEIKAKTRTSL